MPRYGCIRGVERPGSERLMEVEMVKKIYIYISREVTKRKNEQKDKQTLTLQFNIQTRLGKLKRKE